ncbi:MAG: NAD(P)H-dependent oxidoreductase [Deltaproteobacteria bacterium]|nr:NAD(P)H-dependent oxidoreductase [Deltaproteobacteria bacterium]
MKVLALNSSARKGGQSKTEWMLASLATGMVTAGAAVDVVHLRDKKIRYCTGCFTCWTKTPGQCVLQDDMTKELLPKLIEADLVVYATPLYHHTVNAHMKTFIERTLPCIEPFFEKRNGKTSHPMRHDLGRAVVLSVAGFPEFSAFDQLSAYVNHLFGDRLVAEIYRPAAESLMQAGMEQRRAAIASALRSAGSELIEKGFVTEKTMADIHLPIARDVEQFHVLGNMFWKTCIREGITPKQFVEKKVIPRPDSIKEFMLLTGMAFNPEGAGDMAATLQYKFSGAVEGNCHFIIAEGALSAREGVCEDPSLTIDTPFDLWMDIMTGKADGQQMFMEQKYTAEGDVALLMKMRAFFGSEK